MVAYEIVNESACSRSSLVKPFRSLCLPENVTTVYFAGIGGTLGENTAYFTDHEATGYVTVTLADCAFVAEAVYGVQDEDAVSENTQYLNETLSIDAASFRIPPSCPQGEKRREIPNRLGMLRKLLSA
ncbi:hypothetical protein C0Q70_03123 [Pomacea canaliculata]|uniref:Uncharacterized protein n=1 Tax=Pomacea canaliculata TaxID=400727 RepID=A0A2T7PRY0_POMCA|nr:uncharacterized protein LOC112556590 [Pomacea canaliculata]PVD36150.1 hypothetical protein C0Q70_03123 [Pomacea canaliculata]